MMDIMGYRTGNQRPRVKEAMCSNLAISQLGSLDTKGSFTDIAANGKLKISACEYSWTTAGLGRFRL